MWLMSKTLPWFITVGEMIVLGSVLVGLVQYGVLHYNHLHGFRKVQTDEQALLLNTVALLPLNVKYTVEH